MSVMSEFNGSVFVSHELSRMLTNAAQDLAQRAVRACGEQYKFDSSEAIRMLGLESVKLERKVTVKRAAQVKIVSVKAAFPLPFNGECNENCCQALRQNNGLYTQCQSIRKNGGDFCKSCQQLSDKNGGVPEYGTISERMAVGIFDYIDPKGRKPVSYTKVMKKYKLSEEQVIAEAGKLNMTIAPEHFIVQETVQKRGRPSSTKEKVAKETKGVKGRPKKEKKVLQIEGEEEDLFASLVADANSSEIEEVENNEEEMMSMKKADEEAKAAKKEEERKAKEAEKAAKKEEERLAKEAKKKAEEEAKAAKKKAEEEAKAAKKEEERLAKEAKAAKKEEERLAKEAKKKADLEKGESKKKKESSKESVKEDDEEPDVVKKIEVDGKKYLKSKKTGIVYDYIEYTKNGNQVVVGKWNDSKNKIDFKKDDSSEEEDSDAEESADEYDE